MDRRSGNNIGALPCSIDPSATSSNHPARSPGWILRYQQPPNRHAFAPGGSLRKFGIRCQVINTLLRQACPRAPPVATQRGQPFGAEAAARTQEQIAAGHADDGWGGEGGTGRLRPPDWSVGTALAQRPSSASEDGLESSVCLEPVRGLQSPIPTQELPNTFHAPLASKIFTPASFAAFFSLSSSVASGTPWRMESSR